MTSHRRINFLPEDPTYKNYLLWDDPLKDEPPGLLLSDRIAYYAKTMGLIVPFNEKDLRPATYTLHVGDTYYYNDVHENINVDESITIRPNGLCYIKIYEYFNIPYYMVGSYSLRVQQIYRGLILDNGLQIDPGYHGYINVPIYNFTKEDKVLRYRDPLLSIEFTRTTPFSPSNTTFGVEDKDWVGNELIGYGGNPLRVLRTDPRKIYDQKTIEEYFSPREKNESSVEYLDNEVKKFGKTLENMKTELTSELEKYKYIGISALAIIILTVIGYIYTTQNRLADIEVSVTEAKNKVEIQEIYNKEKKQEIEDKIEFLKGKESTLSTLFSETNKRLLTINNSFNNFETLQNDYISRTKNLEDELKELKSKLKNPNDKNK